MTNRIRTVIGTVALLLVAGACGASTASSVEGASWQPHHVQFDYFGITARYSCDGLEGKVRQILLYLGARADVRVRATGCPRGGESISRSAWVTADFSTLSATATSASASSPAPDASWTTLKLSANRPFFMGDGDCELVDQMRKVLTDNFSWRGQVTINTRCAPYTTSIYDYQIAGEVLKLDAAPKG
jgi:hypothetical protein